ncbi:MAG: hypothetical protein ACRDZO_03530 [Egibacteraceae bacterium]
MRRRLSWLAAAAVVLIVVAAAAAQAQEGCGVPAAASWTATEAAVWRQLCVGEVADLNGEAENLDPHQPDGWDGTRVLSSTFVEQLLTQPYAAAVDRHGIFLVGAWFPDGLDIHEAAVGFPLRCQYCRIADLRADEAVVDGTLDLRGSAIEGDLSLLGADLRSDLLVGDGSVVSGTLTADRLTIVGAVFLDNGSQFTHIILTGADIGGNLEVGGGSVVSGTLTADGLTVAGNVFLRDGSTFTDIRLPGADIGGNLSVSGGSVVSGTLNADGLTVAGPVFLSDGSTFTDIRLLGADIGGNLEVGGGAVVSGTLEVSRVTVADDVFLDDGSQFTDINLLGADIGGQLAVVGGAVVSGTLNANRFTVAGSVLLRDGSTFNDVILSGAGTGGLIVLDGARWEPGGSLDLRQARVGGVWTDEREDSLPARLRLDGFTFDLWANPDPRTLGSGWFTDTWLGRLDGFSPGPYNQLAEVMDAGGHPTIAADVRYQRSNEERQAVGWTRPDRWGRQAHWLVLGYGLQPWRALGWLFAVWLTGFLVFRLRLEPARRRVVKRTEWSAAQAALYSLDRLVPAVKLVDPDEFPKLTRAQQVWSTVQMLLGWLLTLFIVGWLGSLLVQT